MQYTIIRSKRKSLALQIKPDGALTVRAPLFVTDEQIAYFVQSHAAWIDKHRRRVLDYAAAHPAPTADEIAALRKKAQEVLPPLIAKYAALLGVTPTGVKITSASKRFGSCSGKNALCFSYRLMAYPLAAIEYVVVHELAHIRHHNHSKAFYQTIAAILPDYREREKLLK